MYLYLYPIYLLASFLPGLKLFGGKLFLFFVMQILGLVLALDVNMTDYFNYERIYKETAYFGQLLSGEKSFSDGYGEFGYVLLSSIAKSLGLGYDPFRVVYFTLLMSIIWIFFVRFKVSIFFASLWYFAYFFHNDGNIIRMAMASSIVMVGIGYLSLGYVRRFLILILVASAFHVSVLACLVLLFFYYFRPKRLFFIIALVVGLIIGLKGGAYILGFLGKLSFFSDSSVYIISKIVRYLDAGREGAGLLRSLVVVSMTILVFFLVNFNRMYISRGHYIWFCSLFITLLFLLVFSDLRLFSDRMFRLFGMSGGVLLGFLVQNFQGINRLVVSTFLVIFFSAFLCFKYYSLSWSFLG